MKPLLEMELYEVESLILSNTFLKMQNSTLYKKMRSLKTLKLGLDESVKKLPDSFREIYTLEHL